MDSGRTNAQCTSRLLTRGRKGDRRQVDDYFSAVAKTPYYSNGLDPRVAEVRLLTLLQGQGDDPVECTLDHASIQVNQPIYETISYAWGDAAIRGQVSVDGRSISVTASAEAALRTVRLPSASRVIWIDALCINQYDPIERAQQVLMMGIIYASSIGNLVYLGRDETAAVAIKSMKDMLQSIREKLGAVELRNILIDERTSTWKRTTVRPFAMVDEVAFVVLISQPWFGRLWVLQEVFAAPRNTCLYAGGQFLLLDLLHACAWIMGHREHFGLPLASSAHLENSVMMWYYLEDAWDSGQKRLTLISAMDLIVGRKTSDPRDKIFALLGLLRCTSNIRGETPPLLMPNYEKPFKAVLLDAIKFTIWHEHGLHSTLWRVDLCENLDELGTWPSWLPQQYLHGVQGHDVIRLGDSWSSDKSGKALLLYSKADVLRSRGFTLGHVARQTRHILRHRDKVLEFKTWFVEVLVLAHFYSAKVRTRPHSVFSLLQIILENTLTMEVR